MPIAEAQAMKAKTNLPPVRPERSRGIMPSEVEACHLEQGRALVPQMCESRKQGLAPVAREDARVLILGSLPGEMSLRDSRYYAHPRNQFWRLVGKVIQHDLTSLGYDARLGVLAKAGIALWDMVAVGRRMRAVLILLCESTHWPMSAD